MSQPDFLCMLMEIVENDKKCSSEDFGAMLVPPIAFWTRLFSEYFLHSNSTHHDDMLFYVKKDPKLHKGKPEVTVYRRESDKNPGLGDPSFDWSETVYLNMILQQMEYTLTCAICDRRNGDLRIQKLAKQKVYASPSRHDMDAKSSSSEMSYPNIFFTIDSFDEVWDELYLADGEVICVEIVAHDKDKNFESVIFLGSVGYEALLKAYQRKTDSASNWVGKLSGLFSNQQSDNFKQFVRMKGPAGKGYAEMAVEKCSQASQKQATGIVARHAFPVSKSDPSSLSSQASSNPSNAETNQSLPSTPKMNRSKPLLRSHLTYVTLPWHKITLDILKDFETPSERKPPVLRG